MAGHELFEHGLSGEDRLSGQIDRWTLCLNHVNTVCPSSELIDMVHVCPQFRYSPSAMWFQFGRASVEGKTSMTVLSPTEVQCSVICDGVSRYGSLKSPEQYSK